jgi:hypothetical protein
MKFPKLLIFAICVTLLVAVDLFAENVSPLVIGAMAIPIGALYNLAEWRQMGERAIHHPSEYKRTLAAEGEIGFGLAVVRGTNPGQGKLIGAAGNVFLGVASRSTEAGKFDEGKYIDKDVLAIYDTGIPSVYVEEAVNEHSPVRIRHTVGDAPAEIVGGFCTTADEDKTLLLAGARFMGSTTGAGVVPLQLLGIYTQTPDAGE